MIRTSLIIAMITMSVYSAGLVYFGAPHYVGQCVFGVVLMTANFSALYWSFRKIVLEKKSIALATTVIVSKYAVLIGLLAILYVIGWRVNLGFALGLSVMFPLIAWTAVSYMKQRENDGSL